jgi:hypothetical protein
MDKIEDVLVSTREKNKRLHGMVQALKLAEKTDKEALPILETLDPLISPLCNKAVLLTETAFDYEGLSQEQSARMNLQQTYTIYSGLFNASNYLVKSLDDLLDRIEAAHLI